MSEEELSSIYNTTFGNPLLNDKHTSLHWDIYVDEEKTT